MGPIDEIRGSEGSKFKFSKKKRNVENYTLILLEASKPSSWLRSSSIVRCTSLSPLPLPDSIRVDPILSISSMKIIDGACSLNQTQTKLSNELFKHTMVDKKIYQFGTHYIDSIFLHISSVALNSSDFNFMWSTKKYQKVTQKSFKM